MDEQASTTRTITLADSAVVRLRKLLGDQNKPDGGLRIAVRGGGCSGLTYSMELADRPQEKDKVFERDGVKVFVDPKSFLYLAGTELVFEETLTFSAFKLHNPNAKSTCGCGESFSV